MSDLIPIEVAHEMAKKATDVLPVSKLDTIAYLIQCCPTYKTAKGDCYSLAEVKGFLHNFYKFVEEKDHNLLTRRRGLKVAREVDIIEFVESEEFMGMKGNVYPAVKESLWEQWHNPEKQYHEIILTGATNRGKSFMLEMNISYMVYRLAIQWNPQAEFDLAPGSPLYFVLQAGSYLQARNVLFRPLHSRMLRTKFFTEIFPFRKDVQTELIFPNNIYVTPFSGSDDAVLGLTVPGGGITELNRMAVTKKSKKNRHVDQEAYDQAVSIYETLVRRIVGRTMQLGKLWGKLVLDAAHEHPDDFTSKRIKAAQTNPKIYVYQGSQWEILPQDRFSGEKFLVEKGTDRYRSRILLDRDQALDDTRVIEVPVEYKEYFEQDCEGALRDFGGETIALAQTAIPYREKIADGMENFKKITGGRQFFKHDQVILDDFVSHTGRYGWHELVDLEYVKEVLLDKHMILAGHMDPALNHCNMGIALGHINGWKLAPPFKRFDAKQKAFVETHKVSTPISMVDGILAVSAKRGEEIDLETAQALIIYIFENTGLKLFSVDSYQSAQMQQAWRTVGLATGRVSVDDTVEPYTRLKLGYRDERVITPEHPIYHDEVVNLQFEDGKFDHLPGKSKDCSDAVAGTIYLIETHIVEFSPDVGSDRKVPFSGRRLGRRISNRPS